MAAPDVGIPRLFFEATRRCRRRADFLGRRRMRHVEIHGIHGWLGDGEMGNFLTWGYPNSWMVFFWGGNAIEKDDLGVPAILGRKLQILMVVEGYLNGEEWLWSDCEWLRAWCIASFPASTITMCSMKFPIPQAEKDFKSELLMLQQTPDKGGLDLSARQRWHADDTGNLLRELHGEFLYPLA